MAELLRAAARWSRRVWMPYTLLAFGVVAVTTLAGNRNPILAALCILPLAAASAWLGEMTRQHRRAGGGAPPGRTVLAVVQLAFGLALAGVGLEPLGGGVDWLFFLGLALVILAVGALIAELRQCRRWRTTLAAGLLVATLVFLVAGAAFDAWWLAVAAAGVLAGELGTELLSEQSHGWTWRRSHWWAVGTLGAVLLGLAIWTLTSAGLEWSHAVYLVAGLLVIVWMASSDSDSLVLLVLLAVALIWAAAPRSVAPDPRRAPVAGEPYFLTLGDSFISGEGSELYLEGTNTTESDADQLNECRQAPRAWPLLLARSQPAEVPGRTMFLACSGAVSENVHTEPRLHADGHQLGPAELDLYERRLRADDLDPPELVLIMVGGNDAGFGDIVLNCVGPGNCAEVGQQFLDDPERGDRPDDAEPPDPFTPPGSGRAEDLARIVDDLDRAYTRIIETVGEGVPVVAVPYPIPVTAQGRCSDVLLQEDERQFVVGFVEQLNHVVFSATRRHGFLFMGTMEQAFKDVGNQLCDESGLRAGVNFVAFNPKSGTVRDSLNPRHWLHNSMHPNVDGHEAMTDAAVRWFRTNPDLNPLDADPGHRHVVPDIHRLHPDWPGVAQCTPVDAAACEVSGSHWLLDQAHELYQSALGPLALAMVGGWLMLTPLMWFGRDHEISTAKVVRARFSRPDT